MRNLQFCLSDRSNCVRRHANIRSIPRIHLVDCFCKQSSWQNTHLFSSHSTGEGCFEKPLATLWLNYTQVQKPDVLMRIKVSPSGLKATTKQHGLTEYWSHRITHCASPKNYPRVFCWIYRHEGRKMKHELRCHALLCSKEIAAKDICSQLQVCTDGCMLVRDTS